MSSYDDLADSVVLKRKKHKVSIIKHDPSLEHIGTGRSAAVFKITSTNKALKVFFPSHEKTAEKEAEIYERLQGIPYYPTLYDSGRNYIVIDFIQGYTLFDCLTHGVKITPSHIQETDYALNAARESGLSPSDVHLRNIILTPEGTIMLIDVARFKQNNGCKQWEDLKRTYTLLYGRSYFPKRLPAFLLNLIANLYNKKLLRLSYTKTEKKYSITINKGIRKSS